MDDGEPGPRQGWQVVSSMSFGGTVCELEFVAAPHAPVRCFVPVPGGPIGEFAFHQLPCRPSAGSILSRSVCFFPQLCVPAGVACHSTLVANVRVQDMDWPVRTHLTTAVWRLWLMGFPFFQGAQLAVDTTLVSVLRRDGVPRQQAATQWCGSVWCPPRKERVHPELTGEMGRTRLVVLAGEVGGRWSEESREFLNQLAKAKARREPRHLRAGRARCGGTDGHLSWLAARRQSLLFLFFLTGS